MSKKSPTIPAPKNGLFGVAIRPDGTLENIGVGSFDTRLGEKLAKQLESLAKKIRKRSRLIAD